MPGQGIFTSVEDRNAVIGSRLSDGDDNDDQDVGREGQGNARTRGLVGLIGRGCAFSSGVVGPHSRNT